MAAVVGIVDGEEKLEILLSWDNNTNLLDGLGELLWLDGATVVQVEVLEGADEDGLLTLVAAGLL